MCPWLPLDSHWKARIAPGVLAKIQKNLRRLSSLDRLQLTKVTSPDEIPPTLETLFDLHVRRWQGTATPSRFADPGMRSRYQQLMGALHVRGELDLSILSVGRQVIAGHFGPRTRSRFYSYITCFDPEWAKYSPGIVLRYLLMADCVEHGIPVYDFLRGDETHKASWGCELAFNVRIMIYRQGILNRALPMLHQWGENLLRQYPRLRQAWKVIRQR
jgi:CelD/BcsL family acetyltransferase involved in cellulose biosynthesis